MLFACMPEPAVELEACVVDLATKTVRRADGSVHELTGREAALLSFLLQHPSRVLSRDELLASVWEVSDATVSRACDNAVRRLRTKIEADPSRPRHLVTAHGEGYRFEPLHRFAAARVLQLGPLEVDLGRHLVVHPDGDEQALSGQEVAILTELARADGAVVARDVLQRRVWGRAGGRALDTALRRLRTKLDEPPGKPRWLRTERGGGYRLVVAPGLPVPEGTRLFGRDDLLAELREALGRSTRVVLVGPGGIGKTSLAREAARTWPGRVCWVDAASATRPSDLIGAVAGALDAQVATTEPAAVLGRLFSRFERGLLVLDNLEQAADAVAPLVRAWQQAAPGLGFLGTSRVRLGLDEERVLDVPRLTRDDAVQLFVHRAEAASRTFQLGTEGAGTVEAIVDALEGSPLAIELAAAHTPVLSLDALLGRLDRALDLLHRPRAEVDRHRSLRASIEASWSLLDDADRRALLQLACFEGPFSLDDAEALLGVVGLARLQGLVDHSLVKRRRRQGSFRLFTAIRSFARDELASWPDAQALRYAYLERMARLGEPEHLASLDRADAAVVRRQDRAASELEAAAKMALALGANDLAARCALGAAWSRDRRGPFDGSIELLRTLGRHDATEPALRARLHTALARLLRTLDQPADALQAVAMGLAIADDRAMAD
ncbi:MAG: winged helix-turn-helix domain-containing protein, partial [Myxococcota bacterium]